MSAQEKIFTRDIIKAASEFYAVPVSEIRSESRKARISHIRQVAMYLASTKTKNSSNAIAIAFKRDGSTVRHSIRKMKLLLKENSNIQREIDIIWRCVANARSGHVKVEAA